jgi:5'-AMP-activated protein kinase regulatory beta subunit
MKIDKGRGVPVAQESKENAHFELNAEPGDQVSVAGSFNNWSMTATPLAYNSGKGHFNVALYIPKGTYEYVFVVNGVWVDDPMSNERIPNSIGSMNNVLHV